MRLRRSIRSKHSRYIALGRLPMLCMTEGVGCNRLATSKHRCRKWGCQFRPAHGASLGSPVAGARPTSRTWVAQDHGPCTDAVLVDCSRAERGSRCVLQQASRRRCAVLAASMPPGERRRRSRPGSEAVFQGSVCRATPRVMARPGPPRPSLGAGDGVGGGGLGAPRASRSLAAQPPRPLRQALGVCGGPPLRRPRPRR